MKKIACLSAALFLGFSAFAVDVFTLVNLTGKVKSYTKTNFEVTTKFGNYFRTPVLKETHAFNDGNETEIIQLTPRDVVTGKISFTYDKDNRLAEKLNTNPENVLQLKTTYTYTNELKSDSSEYDISGALKKRTIFTYENGRLVDETDYDGEGVLTAKNIYAYSDAGYLATTFYYNADGSLKEKKEYTYNVDQRLDSIASYDKDLKQISLESIRYDEAGLISEVTTYVDNRVTKRTLLKYDSTGNVMRVSEYNISEKFGTTVNELTSISELVYEY